jgi:CubicO group peptidase (beta-lactamase class C family)
VGEGALAEIAELVVTEGAAPSAAVAAAVRTEGGWLRGSGTAGTALIPAGTAIFDLASVTKPFVAVLAARLARSGLLALGDPLERHLPEIAGTASARVPLLLLLAHRAGLEAHRPLFAPLVARRPFERLPALRSAANARRADARGDPPEAGFSPLYSDLGYVLAGAALERAAGHPLDELIAREVSAPLALDARSARLWLAFTPSFSARVLPTETVAFRGGEVRGVVHDENAWAVSGHGVAGQAGLFATADAVVGFGIALLDAVAGRKAEWLRPEEIAPLVAERPDGSLRAGFDGKSGDQPAAGPLASARTFGHLGFTGTSLWCDPVAERVTVLLSNRVCPTRDNGRIRAVRPRVHARLSGFGGGLVTGDQA